MTVAERLYYCNSMGGKWEEGKGNFCDYGASAWKIIIKYKRAHMRISVYLKIYTFTKFAFALLYAKLDVISFSHLFQTSVN